jgi:hypothetical protein
VARQPVGNSDMLSHDLQKNLNECELELHLIWFPVSVVLRIKVMNTKILYLELNCFLTGIFALIGKRPYLRIRRP